MSRTPPTAADVNYLIGRRIQPRMFWLPGEIPMVRPCCDCDTPTGVSVQSFERVRRVGEGLPIRILCEHCVLTRGDVPPRIQAIAHALTAAGT